MKITAPSDCGNAPRKAMLRDFTVSLVRGDEREVGDAVAEDVSWELVGKVHLDGRTALLAGLPQLASLAATELHIKNIITHGKTAAVEFSIVGRRVRLECCDIYIFRGSARDAKIGSARSFRVTP